MCNINTLYRKNNKKVNVVGFIQSVSSHSWISNNHGEGVFFSGDDNVFKSEKKIDYTKPHLSERIDNSRVIITHQRFSTSGFKIKYNHPFSNEDFVLVHNGVVNQFLNGSGSDTHGLFNEFNKEFKKLQGSGSRQKRIIQTIKNLFDDNRGTYSILIFDKKTRQSYYFRNFPAINFYKNDEFLFITTESNNQKFLSLISDKKFVQLDIKSREIYHITGKGEVFKVGGLPEIKYSYFDDDEDTEEEKNEDEDEEQRNLFDDIEKENKEKSKRKYGKYNYDEEFSFDQINEEIEKELPEDNTKWMH